MRILITGVTGRIGANLAAELLGQGHQVRGLVWERDVRTSKLAGHNVEFVSGSLTNSEDVRRAMDGMQAVYHLGAAFQGGGPFKTEDYFEINVRGTFNVLEAAKEQTDLRHLLIASTDSVYKKSAPGGMREPITVEKNLPEARGWYGLSKVMAEEMVISYYRTYNMPATVIRFPNTVGAGEFYTYGAFWLSKQQSRPELAPLWTGEERLTLLRDENGRTWKKHMGDVRDVVHGCAVALGKEKSFGQVFQLGAPRAFEWETLIPYMSKKTGIPYVEARIGGDPTSYEYDITKARNLLGYDPQYDEIRMIDDAIAFRKGENIGVLPT